MMITMRPAAQSCMARGYLQARRSHDLRAQEVGRHVLELQGSLQEEYMRAPYGGEAPCTSHFFTAG